MNQIRLEKGQPKLLGFVSEIRALIGKEAKKGKMLPWSQEDLERQIKSRESYLAICGHKLVGYVSLSLWTNYIEICALIVRPCYRKKGYGTKLVQGIKQLALRQFPGKKLIILPNKISFQISKKLGFIEREKSEFDLEIWQGCSSCKEFALFPQCHCQPMIYEKITAIAQSGLNPKRG